MSSEMTVLGLMLGAGIVVKCVLVLLLTLSLASWAVIFNKWRRYRKSRREGSEFASAFWGGSDMDTLLAGIPSRYPNSPLPNIFQAGYREFMRQQQEPSHTASMKIVPGQGLEGIRRTLDAALSRELEGLSRHLAFLATVGSTSPFIGLFGTVWGIMGSFQQIGLTKNTSLATVAPGIAEALVATAFGLVAAIPAVIAYNKFSSDLKRTAAEMDQFASEFLNVIGRHLRH